MAELNQDILDKLLQMKEISPETHQAYSARLSPPVVDPITQTQSGPNLPSPIIDPSAQEFQNNTAATREPAQVVPAIAPIGQAVADEQSAADQNLKAAQVINQSALALKAKAIQDQENAYNLAFSDITKEQGKLNAEYDAAQAEIKKNDLINAAREKERQAQLDDASKKIQDATNEYIGKDINSDRWWNSKGTGEKILYGLAMVFSPLNKKNPNAVFDIINKEIDKDIQNQKDAITRKGSAIDAQKNLYSSLRTRFADERDAEIASKMVAIDRVKLEAERLAAMTKNVETKANFAGLQTQLTEKKAQLMQEMAASAVKKSENKVDNLKSIIDSAPEKDRDNLIKEKGDQDRFDKSKLMAAQQFKEMGELSFLEPRLFDAKASSLSAAVREYVKGMNSEADMAKVDAMLPRKGDSDSTLKQKALDFNNFLERQRPAAPYLNHYGLSPKPLNLGAPK